VVTGVARFGLFVQLLNNLVEGLVHVERLGPEEFDFDAARHELRSIRGSAAFRLGDPLRVRVERVDRALLRVDLAPAGGAAAPAAADVERGGRARKGAPRGRRGPAARRTRGKPRRRVR
jgi:ribonuclease R